MPLKPEWEALLVAAALGVATACKYTTTKEGRARAIADAFRPILIELEAAVRREALEEAAFQCDACEIEYAVANNPEGVEACQECADDIRALAEPATEEK